MVKPKKRGRPATGRDPLVGFRADPKLRARIEEWMKTQSEGPRTLSAAIRSLVEIGLAATAPAPPLDQQLARVEKKLARKVPTKPSPEKGVALLQHGLAELEHQALVAKKVPGHKTAADSDAARRPDQATGKKGRGVKDGSLTRHAPVSKTSKVRKP